MLLHRLFNKIYEPYDFLSPNLAQPSYFIGRMCVPVWSYFYVYVILLGYKKSPEDYT